MSIAILIDANIVVGTPAGSGLYGRVWEAQQHGRTVAVKIIHPEMRKVANALEHFHSLARVQQHPNIVQVFTVARVNVPGEPEPVEAVIMEWLDGISLDHQLRGPVLQLTEGIKLCSGIIDGLSHLHTSGVAHGDLHAGNVIITAEGPKIIDIDCSKSNSLRMLTLHSREDRIQSDLDYVRHLVWRILSHTDINLAISTSIEPNIRGAPSLESIRGELKSVLATVVAAAKATPAVIRSSDGTTSAPTAPRRSREDMLSRPDVQRDELFKGVLTLSERNQPLTARNVVQSHVRRFVKYITSDRFSAQASGDEEEFRSRVADYDTASECSCTCVSALAFAGASRSAQLILESLDLVSNCFVDLGPRGGTTWWLDLEVYPAALLLYAAGISATAAQNYGLLREILVEPKMDRFARERERLSSSIWHWKAQHNDTWNHIYGKRYYTPVSGHLEAALREVLREVAFLDSRYVELFDRFEYLSALVEIQSSSWVPIGSYIWRGARENRRIWDQVRKESEDKGAEWPPVRNSLFRSAEEFAKAQQGFGEFIDKHGVLGRYM